MNDLTKKKAFSTLDRMSDIVRREMMISGVYVTSVIDFDLHDQGAICGGRKHCAIGSLWAGYGIQVQPSSVVRHRGRSLPGVFLHDRAAFMRNRPALKAAYEALNAAARRYGKRHGIRVSDDNSMEELFEDYWGDKLTKRDLLRIISMAKTQINKA